MLPSRHLVLSLIMFALVAGCASAKKNEANRAQTAFATASNSSATQSLMRLAAEERSEKRASSRPLEGVSVPPGIDPPVLLRRDPSDPIAFLTLEQAIERVSGEVGA